ncbi:DUF4234 domain-containing protein [Paenibacillus koleovorans]|uniref:DUF4234 domain-containing protein n=1 Tax=Paenibacillus koleovorans TaxID=121608 RepID=UPI000FDB5FE4|nr:DUF4234 domain-containing protein [Paenibacillus koleovorans]
MTNLQIQQELSTERSFQPPYSNVQPVWHLILLTVLTFGLYQMVWIYKTWKQLCKHNNWNINYVFRTVFTFIPIIGFIIVPSMFKRIKMLLKQKEIELRIYPVPFMLTFYVLNALFRLPSQYWLLGFLSIIPIAYTQYGLNIYWRKEQMNHVVISRFTKRQWILITLGSLLWILTLIGMFGEQEGE